MDMTLSEFTTELLKLNNAGKEATAKHKELYPATKAEGDLKGGRRYHAPATGKDCPYCNKIIKNHDDYMALQKKVFGLTGIPFEPLMSAVNITVGTLQMLNNEESARQKEAAKVIPHEDPEKEENVKPKE